MGNDTGIEVVNVIGHMKKKGSFKAVMLLLLLGAALLVMGSFAFSDREKQESADTQGVGEERVEEYKRSLREEVERLCLGVDGVESARAVVFFDGVGSSIYAVNTQTGSTSKTEYVIIGSGSGAHALYLGESMPRPVGIGVVCDTGGRDEIRDEIAMLISSLYGLPLTRVYVSEGK